MGSVVALRATSPSPVASKKRKRMKSNFSQVFSNGWFDANLSKPAELDKIAEGHGYARAKGTVDTKIHLEGLVFTLCYEGSEECDAEGFIDEITGAYNAKEIK